MPVDPSKRGIPNRGIVAPKCDSSRIPSWRRGRGSGGNCGGQKRPAQPGEGERNVSLSGRLRATKDAIGSGARDDGDLPRRPARVRRVCDRRRARVPRAAPASVGVDAAALAGAQELPDRRRRDRHGAVALRTDAGASRNDVIGVAINPVERLTLSACATVGCSSRRGRQNAHHGHRVLGGPDVVRPAPRTRTPSPSTPRRPPARRARRRSSTSWSSSTGQARWQDADLDGPNERQGGSQTFLRAMDPELDHVGLGVFPPAIGTAAPALRPTDRARRRQHVLDTRSASVTATTPGGRAGTAVVDAGATAPSTRSPRSRTTTSVIRVRELDAQRTPRPSCRPSAASRPAGTTSYANALIEAKRELDAERPRRRAGRDRLLHRRRRQHDADALQAPDTASERRRIGIRGRPLSQIDLGATGPGRAAPASQPPTGPRATAAERRSTPSATTSTARTAGTAASRVSPPSSALTGDGERPEPTSIQPAAGDDLGVVFERDREQTSSGPPASSSTTT